VTLTAAPSSSKRVSQHGAKYDSAFDLALIAVTIERIQRIAGFIKRNVAAREFGGAKRGGTR